MVILGLVLLVLAVVATIGVVASNGSPVNAEAFGVSIENVSVGGLFLAGVATGLVGLLGLFLLLGGAARKRSKRKAVKNEVREVRGERESLVEENARLQAELDQQRSAAATQPAYPAEPALRSDTTVDGPHGTDDADRKGRHRLLGR